MNKESLLFDGYLNKYLFDVNSITPYHLEYIRAGLVAYYKRIKNIEITANLNECSIWLVVHFKWWAFGKKKLCNKIKGLLKNNLPYAYTIVGENKGTPITDYTEYNINIGIKRITKVKWL